MLAVPPFWEPVLLSTAGNPSHSMADHLQSPIHFPSVREHSRPTARRRFQRMARSLLGSPMRFSTGERSLLHSAMGRAAHSMRVSLLQTILEAASRTSLFRPAVTSRLAI